jgi:GNAT superfamily N-acetyltransferase
MLRDILIWIQRNALYRRHVAPRLLGNTFFGMNAQEDGGYRFFCQKNDRIIASLYLYDVHEHVPREGWWIYGLSVHRLYRHLNIGSRLMNHVFEFIRGRSDSMIYVLVQRDFPDVIKFYEKLGFFMDCSIGANDVDPQFVLMSRDMN